MALNSSAFVTLRDVANITNSRNQVATPVEMLMEQNPILEDIPLQVGMEKGGSLRAVIRTGLPRVSFRSFNEAVKPSHGTTASIIFNSGMIEGYCETDAKLADMHGNASALRQADDKAFLQSMSNEMADTIFYGDEATNPRKFTGLAKYYDEFSSTAGQPGYENMIDGKNAFSATAATASDHLNSVWLIGWGPEGITGFTPEGLPTGYTMKDLGLQLITTDNATSTDSGRIMHYVSYHSWSMGIAPVDWRCAVRIPNVSIKPENVTGYTTSTPGFQTLPELMHEAMMRLPKNKSNMKVSWYMSRPCATQLNKILQRSVGGSTLKAEDVGGKMMTEWEGVPVKTVDVLAKDEGLVT